MNPYEVLGVSETASDEEIRRAYRELVKKYHPDQFADNPLKDLANEKLKQVNEAYDLITKQRAGRSSGASGSSSGSYSGGYSGGSSSGAGSYGNSFSQFQRVRQLLSAGNLNMAQSVLNSIPDRTAEWYYLSGVIALRRGAYDTARENIGRATQMDPSNAEYRNAYTTLTNSYRTYGRPTTGNGGGLDVCQVCQTLWCLDCCCECMGGDFIRCC